MPESIQNFNMYYGMNVSKTLALEPIDQLDGFLIASQMQKLEESNFYPFIAGLYESLNAQSSAEARLIARKRMLAENRKKILLENIMRNLKLEGTVYTTNDLWKDELYWEIVREVIPNIDKTDCRKSGIEMREFPVEIFGKYGKLAKDIFIQWRSASLYVPLEVAEAIWFKERKYVSIKIGPCETETVFDKIIKKYDIGIIGIKQPKCVYNEFYKGKNNGSVNVVPYIGRRNQERIFFSDFYDKIEYKIRKNPMNPSYKRAVLMSSLESNYPISDSAKIARLIKLGGLV